MESPTRKDLNVHNTLHVNRDIHCEFVRRGRSCKIGRDFFVNQIQALLRDYVLIIFARATGICYARMRKYANAKRSDARIIAFSRVAVQQPIDEKRRKRSAISSRAIRDYPSNQSPRFRAIRGVGFHARNVPRHDDNADLAISMIPY